jgi:hypothetical protein
MFQTSDSGMAWREAPIQLGAILVSSEFRSATLLSYDKIRKVAKKQEVPLIDLMAHEQVSTYFAKLVALEMADPTAGFGGRNQTVTTSRMVVDSHQRLLGLFEKLEYNADGFLVFGGGNYDHSKNQQRRATEQLRTQFLQQTGHYFSDRYAPGSMGDQIVRNAAAGKRPGGNSNNNNGRSKKPVYGLAADQQAEQRRRQGVLGATSM